MKMKFRSTLAAACLLMITVPVFAQNASVASFTEQVKDIKKDDKYKIFTMSGEGLVALGPKNPKGLKEAFSPDVVVSSVEFEKDSIDIQGNPHVKTIVFARASGDVEATVLQTLGDYPYYADAKDRNNSDHVVLLVNGDFYFLKLNTLDPNVHGEDTWGDIDFIISKNKLAGMKGDPKSIEEHKTIVRNYYTQIRAEKEKIIAAALEKLRKENSLEGRDVKNIELVMENEYVIPGMKTRIGVVANLKDGNQLKTFGIAKGKTFWSDYTVTVTGGTYDGRGNISTSEEFSAANKDQVTFTIQSVYIPTLKITKTVNINYARSYSLYLSEDGNFGYPGSSGSGGNCHKGKACGNGTKGNDGGAGTNAGNVTVKINSYTHAQTKEALLKYEITSPKGTMHIVVTPSSVITINANGGNGGSGGSGGGSGSLSNSNSDGLGYCDCNSAISYMGYGGNGGNGGRGGNGGNVSVTVDPSVKDYKLDITTYGGNGGNGGSGGRSDAPDGCATNSAVGDAQKSKSGKPGMGGAAGQKGTVSTQTAKVTLSW